MKLTILPAGAGAWRIAAVDIRPGCSTDLRIWATAHTESQVDQAIEDFELLLNASLLPKAKRWIRTRLHHHFTKGDELN